MEPYPFALIVLVVFWFLRTVRQILFWLYLWQLKEYHVGRFWDHFRTAQGKQIFLNPLLVAKLVAGGGFFAFPAALPPVLFALYFFESAKILRDAARGLLKKPVFTFKVFFLVALALLAVVQTAVLLFLFFLNSPTYFSFGLLLFDIFAPLIVSAIVLAFQPLTALWRRTLLEKAKRKRLSLPTLIVIGITGSYGKTSTKEFLAAVLSERFKVLKTKEHQNSEIGVARCILDELHSQHEIFICEMGAYGKGGIQLLCDIANPKIGILTGINEQHMATFGSQERITATKFELIRALPSDGVAILNFDSDEIKNQIPLSKNINPNLKNIIVYSIKEKNGDIWAEDREIQKEYISFRVCKKNNECVPFRVNVLGAHFMPNLLAVAACAQSLGMSMAEIAQACKKITPEMGGMTLRKGIKGATVIEATYSANPDGVISHIEYLRCWEKKKIIIMPCLIELGRASKQVHRRIGRKIGEVCTHAIIVTKEHFRDVKAGAREVGMKEENVLFLENPEGILQKIKDHVGEEDVILLEGRLPKQLIREI